MDVENTDHIIRKISCHNSQVLQLTHILSGRPDIITHLSMASDKTSWTANAYIFFNFPSTMLEANLGVLFEYLQDTNAPGLDMIRAVLLTKIPRSALVRGIRDAIIAANEAMDFEWTSNLCSLILRGGIRQKEFDESSGIVVRDIIKFNIASPDGVPWNQAYSELFGLSAFETMGCV